MPLKPFENSRLAQFVTTRVLELRGRKTQAEIAAQAGFTNPNVMSMLKSGANKLPLDRVPSLAKALECDPAYLLLLALEQPQLALRENTSHHQTNQRTALSDEHREHTTPGKTQTKHRHQEHMTGHD